MNSSGAPDLVARRSIIAGEEITFDYAMRNYSVEHFPAKCLCGSAQCREIVTGWKGLSRQQKESYRALAAPYLFAIDSGRLGDFVGDDR